MTPPTSAFNKLRRLPTPRNSVRTLLTLSLLIIARYELLCGIIRSEYGVRLEMYDQYYPWVAALARWELVRAPEAASSGRSRGACCWFVARGLSQARLVWPLAHLRTRGTPLPSPLSTGDRLCLGEEVGGVILVMRMLSTR